MPRKAPRPPSADDWAADRIRYEREQRGWSTAELARRVTFAGVMMRQQQVWQVESGQPRRRLSVGEASAFATVFGISLAELMTPPDTALTSDLMRLGFAFAAWRRDAGALFGRLLDIARQVEALDPDEIERAEIVVKYGGLLEAAGQAISQLKEIESMISDVREAIARHEKPWSVIVSMRDIPAEDEGQADGSH